MLALSGKPHENGFFCGDESINRPYRPDMVPTSTLYAVGFTAPFLVIFLVEGWIYYRRVAIKLQDVPNIYHLSLLA